MIPIHTRFKRFPPIVCRLLARKNISSRSSNALEPMPDEEIAKRAGMSVAEVRSLSWQTSWDSVPCGIMLRFSESCGVDFSSRDSMNKHSRYIRNRHRFVYLKRHPQYNTLWKPMITTYTDYLRSLRS